MSERGAVIMNLSTRILALAHSILLILTSLPCSSAFYSPVQSRIASPPSLLNHVDLRQFRFAMVSDSSIAGGSNADDDGDGIQLMDLRSFLTQRCIQSFMFLLASTRDLHTVWWLDNFIKPIIINVYDWDVDEEAKPVSFVIEY